MILTIDDEVDEDVDVVLEGRANTIVMGKKGIEDTKGILSIRCIASIKPGCHIESYYKVTKANLKRVDHAEYPIRNKFDVAIWVKLENPAKFGMARAAYRGFCKTKEEFFKHCKEQAVIDII